MSWSVIAKKDLMDSVRSKRLWILVVVFLLIFGGMAYALTFAPEDILEKFGGLNGNALIQLYTGLGGGFITAFICIIGLYVGHKSVVKERTTHSMRILMGLPHSRGDLVFGKAVGRGALMALSVTLGVLVAVGVMAVFYQSLNIVNFLIFYLVTLLLGLIYVSLGVGLSSSIKTEGRVTGAVIGVFFIFQFIWSPVMNGFLYLTGGGIDAVTDKPSWFPYISQLNPSQAFAKVGGSIVNGTDPVSTYALGVMAVWLIGPLVIGYLLIGRSDI
ncbi:MAG: ABC transporter permease subunit [Halobacteria archaeon]